MIKKEILEEMIEYEKNHTLLYWYNGEIMTKEELYRRIKNGRFTTKI